MVVAALVLVSVAVVALAAGQVARRAHVPGAPAHDVVTEGVVRTAPQWAVEAFGSEAAFEMSGLCERVIDETRNELDANLREQAGFLAKVPVSAVQLLGSEDHDGVGELVLQFAEGSELRVSRIEVVPPLLVDAIERTGGAVRLSSVSLRGRHAVVEVAVGLRNFSMLARTVELEVPTRSAAERRRVLRRYRGR